MTFKNICAKKAYTTKQGEEKVAWLNVGTLKEADNGKQYIELNMFPGLDLYVFDQKERTKAEVKTIDLGDGIKEEPPF